jgi:galactose mutarotase-like enzyme
MGIHGFASGVSFAVATRADNAVCLRLADNPATQAIFPFSFQLDVTYRLTARQLGVAFDVRNTGDVPLPYALGWHPGFAWPFSTGRRDQYSIVFERPEHARQRQGGTCDPADV